MHIYSIHIFNNRKILARNLKCFILGDLTCKESSAIKQGTGGLQSEKGEGVLGINTFFLFLLHVRLLLQAQTPYI